jgi:light-harvesting protein B-800-850 alpha chain
MNQGRIWCVVNPTVGLPLFLGAVAVTSLLVHASILTHTTWMGGYWQGGAKKTATSMADPAADKAALAALAPQAAPVVVASAGVK